MTENSGHSPHAYNAKQQSCIIDKYVLADNHKINYPKPKIAILMIIIYATEKNFSHLTFRNDIENRIYLPTKFQPCNVTKIRISVTY